MQKRIWLYVFFSVLFCGGSYGLMRTIESYNEEILLVLLSSLLLFVFTFLVLPAWKKIQNTQITLLLLSKTLKLNATIDYNPSSLESLGKLSKLVEQSTQFVGTLKRNEGKAEVYDEFKNNDLVKALYELKIHMDTLSKQEAERQWASESMSKCIDLLRTNYQNEQEFYDRILSTLVTLIGANQGGLFLLNDDEGGEKHLALVGCYAYNRKKFIERRIEIGQGLVGQVYLEGATLILKKVPEEYVKITSGLGESLPKFLVIVPLKLNDQTECILELASFEEILPYKIQFLEKVGESIASSIISSRTNQRMKKFLAESQASAEELRSQEEEMRQNMEELEATQEEMGRKEKELVKMLEQSDYQSKELTRQISEIEKLKLDNENYKKDVVEILNSIPAKIFLKDKDGNMVLCNHEVAKAYNLTIEKLIGSHDRDHFDPVQAREFRKQELDVMTTGVKTFVQEERLNGQLRFFKTTKLPFYIHHLGQTGLLGYQFEVTDSYVHATQEKLLQ